MTIMVSKKKASVVADVVKNAPLKTKVYEQELRRLHDKRPGRTARRGGVEVRDIVTRPLRPVPLDQHVRLAPKCWSPRLPQ